MRISDWSSDVCSSDLAPRRRFNARILRRYCFVRIGTAHRLPRGMSNHPNQEKPAPRPISGLWRHGRCGVVVLINTLLAQKLHQVAILFTAACFGFATQAVHTPPTRKSGDVSVGDT